jgi:hypothetical protein
MRNHHPLRTTALLGLGLLVPLAACGDDSGSSSTPADSVAPPETTGDSTVPPTTVPPTTTAPTTPAPTTVPPTTAPVGYEHPDGADDVVVSIAYEGGFVPVETVFTQLPSLLVTGDARQFGLGPVTAIYPGALLPNVQVADIGEDGIQSLLELADEHGLLQEREYEGPTNIADASDTVVTITANGETFVHRAYALGLDEGLGEGTGDTDQARAELLAFVEAATAMGDVQTEQFEPTTYLVRSFPVDDLTGYEIEPTVVEWPLPEIVLADADDCVAVDATAIGETFAEANQLTFFEQDGVTYQLGVKPQLPGDGC